MKQYAPQFLTLMISFPLIPLIMSIAEMLEPAQKRIEDLEATLEKQPLFGKLQMKPDKCIKFYTGFPSFEVLVATFRTLRPTAENMY